MSSNTHRRGGLMAAQQHESPHTNQLISVALSDAWINKYPRPGLSEAEAYQTYRRIRARPAHLGPHRVSGVSLWAAQYKKNRRIKENFISQQAFFLDLEAPLERNVSVAEALAVEFVRVHAF